MKASIDVIVAFPFQKVYGMSKRDQPAPSLAPLTWLECNWFVTLLDRHWIPCVSGHGPALNASSCCWKTSLSSQEPIAVNKGIT